jgi:hypothetical protein
MVVLVLRRVSYMNLLVLVCVNSSHLAINGMEWNQNQYSCSLFTATMSIRSVELLSVVGNEKEGGPVRWQTFAIGLGSRSSWFVCLFILPSSLILCNSASATVKQTQ